MHVNVLNEQVGVGLFLKGAYTGVSPSGESQLGHRAHSQHWNNSDVLTSVLDQSENQAGCNSPQKRAA
jgi:hypothetical protein